MNRYYKTMNFFAEIIHSNLFEFLLANLESVFFSYNSEETILCEIIVIFVKITVII